MLKIKYGYRILNDKKFNKIVVLDFRDYEEDKSSNGGRYAYYIHFDKIADNRFTVSYYTSADFCYCPYCGSFVSNYQYEEHAYNCDEKILSCEEMAQIINNNYANKAGVYIEFS